jgi:hypothetical protein
MYGAEIGAAGSLTIWAVYWVWGMDWIELTECVYL